MRLDPADPAITELLAGPSAATLTIYREDGQASTSPVWPLFAGDAFEVVVAAADGAAYADLARRPQGFRLRIPIMGARAWDLSDILP